MPYFPIFMDLEGKAVLVVGGGKVAARKSRPLLKSGARVSVIAGELGDELADMNSRGEIEWMGSEFTPECIDEFWLAVAATDDPELNRAVFGAGETRRIPVNVVDDARHCRFISPAVIDRDPVQVAVSTGGTSPVLARRIREWIERLLPLGLGKVATAAGSLRKKIGRRLSLEERRRHWEMLLDQSRIVQWSTEPVEAIAKFMSSQFAEKASVRMTGRQGPGRVYLVGAGPGSPDLLTLRAVEVLQQADLILHDRLVPERILERARKDADRVDVGKRAGDHHGVQQRIFHLMVEAARAGKTVVRLKGGDAFVFGRGGEELQHLRAHGIEYEVVPGITAALGCAAYAGIPLTHRDLAHGLTITTGHLSGRIDSVDKGAGSPDRFAQPTTRKGETLVVYMGVKQARLLRQNLLAQGVARSTPAALIIDGTMDRQRVVHGTVSTIPAMAEQVGSGAPGLFIIGAVAALGQELAWFRSGPAYEQAA